VRGPHKIGGVGSVHVAYQAVDPIEHRDSQHLDPPTEAGCSGADIRRRVEKVRQGNYQIRRPGPRGQFDGFTLPDQPTDPFWRGRQPTNIAQRGPSARNAGSDSDLSPASRADPQRHDLLDRDATDTWTGPGRWHGREQVGSWSTAWAAANALIGRGRQGIDGMLQLARVSLMPMAMRS
jgi:hypothetical protein